MTNTRHGDRERTNPLRAIVWGTAAVALLLPAVMMQFTSEVNWGPGDFLVFGAMLLIVCGAYELATRKKVSKVYRLAVGIALLGAFFLTWANLAVGIIGSADNPANLMFFAVLAVGAVIALAVRFDSQGMARAMVVMAVAQAATAVIALFAGWSLSFVFFVFTGFYIIVWLISAQLFRSAALEEKARTHT